MTSRGDTSAMQGLARFVADHRLVVDRPSGSAHPRYPDVVYPVDYGYLTGTTSGDGDGVDVFRGRAVGSGVVGFFVTVDAGKRDVEVKVVVDCTPHEVAAVDALLGRLRLARTWVAAGGGVRSVGGMTESTPEPHGHADHDDRVDTRAELLDEEVSAGSDDPERQAESILEESDERTDDPSGTRADSTQTPGEDS